MSFMHAYVCVSYVCVCVCVKASVTKNMWYVCVTCVFVCVNVCVCVQACVCVYDIFLCVYISVCNYLCISSVFVNHLGPKCVLVMIMIIPLIMIMNTVENNGVILIEENKILKVNNAGVICKTHLLTPGNGASWMRHVLPY